MKSRDWPKRGITFYGRLFISEKPLIVLDYHKRNDQLREAAPG
jgi:adenylosuccinate synthase